MSVEQAAAIDVNTSTRVLFVGQLPPPLHGYSAITAEVLRRLRASNEVVAFDTSGRSVAALFGRWIRFTVSCFVSPNFAVYIAIAGGLRQWIDIFFILIARGRGARLYVHHHSFGYIDAPGLRSRLLMRLLADERHIVLCRCMAARMNRTYGIPSENFFVLSNAAFVATHERTPRASAKRFILGFLGNITIDKGIFEFLELCRALVIPGVKVEGLVAGPVHEDIRGRFDKVLEATTNVRYVGPVYGSQKTEFFREVDVLVFPTRYKNEAQPVTILEASSHAIPTIAFDRGCISEMLMSGMAVTYDEDWLKHLSALLEQLSRPEVLDKMRSGVSELFAADVRKAEAEFLRFQNELAQS